jgi:hypothetical protein
VVSVCVRYCVVEEGFEYESYSGMLGLMPCIDLAMHVIFVSCKWLKLKGYFS